MSPESARPRRPHAPVIKVTVTDEVIAQAEERDSSHCMWAEAIKVAAPWASNVSVDLQTTRMTDRRKGERYTYLTPRPVQVSLIRFDQGDHTNPGSVLLRDGQVSKATNYAARADRRRGDMPEGYRAEIHQAPEGESSGRAATRVGGRPPPMGPLAGTPANVTYRGKRRAFGLRGLDY